MHHKVTIFKNGELYNCIHQNTDHEKLWKFLIHLGMKLIAKITE